MCNFLINLFPFVVQSLNIVVRSWFLLLLFNWSMYKNSSDWFLSQGPSNPSNGWIRRFLPYGRPCLRRLRERSGSFRSPDLSDLWRPGAGQRHPPPSLRRHLVLKLQGFLQEGPSESRMVAIYLQIKYTDLLTTLFLPCWSLTKLRAFYLFTTKSIVLR